MTHPGRVIEIEYVVDGTLAIDTGKTLRVEFVVCTVPKLGQVARRGADLSVACTIHGRVGE
jgi:hypothetical protein